MRQHFSFLAAGLVLSCVFSSAVHAQALPAVNLGFTSFLDGGPPAGPGLYYQQYSQFFSSHEFRDANGNELDYDVDVFVSLNQFIYQSDTPVFFVVLRPFALFADSWMLASSSSRSLRSTTCRTPT